MKTLLACICAVALTLAACNPKSKYVPNEGAITTIEVDVNQVEGQEKPLFSDLKYIKLETSEASLIENVVKVIPFEDKLFLLTSLGGNVAVFDTTGKFCYKLLKGNGPNEIIYPTDIAIDRRAKRVTVLDSYQKTKTFDLQGNSIGEAKNYKTPSLYLETLGEGVLFVDPNLSSQSDHYLRYFMKEGKQVDLLPKFIGGMAFSQPSFFTKLNEDSVLINHIFSDTIYLLDAVRQEMQPRYVIDLKGRSVNRKESLDQIPGYFEYFNYLEKYNMVSGPSDFALLGDKIFLSLNCGGKPLFVAHNLTDHTSHIHTRLFDGLPNNYNSSGRSDRHMYFKFDIPWLIEYFNENAPNTAVTKAIKAACTNENDNPILILGSI